MPRHLEIGMYSLFDTKALQYSNPFYAANDEHAKRIVFDSATPDSQLCRHCDDFVLYHVGNFSPDSGTIVSGSPRSVGNISGMVAPCALTPDSFMTEKES